MIKNISVLFILFAFIVNVNGQDIKQVLGNMPASVIYGLTPDMKVFLAENPKDSTRFVSTAIYEKVRRKAITSDFISLQTSESGTTEIKLLPLINGSKIVCLVQSVCGTICDSRISFYTDKWEPIDRAELFPDRSVEWFVKEDADRTSEKYLHAMSALTMLPMKFSLSPDANIVSVTFDTKGFLPTEYHKAIEPFLNKEAKVLTWDKVRFK